ncbi:MAG TPA: hypothetical protein VGW75_12550 [Solirubrobacteraceae bacterium]|jgi:hypothetical protein|nr:hypothetical protein [Solirubrobacteraceae bacterium]
MTSSGPRVQRGVLLLATLAAFAFGAVIKVASASHYHTNCNGHGLVHGNSTSDSAYHSRVEGGPCQRTSRCDVGQFGNIVSYGGAAAGVTCDNFLSGYGPECYGNAWTRLTDAFDYHRHDAHSPC